LIPEEALHAGAEDLKQRRAMRRPIFNFFTIAAGAVLVAALGVSAHAQLSHGFGAHLHATLQSEAVSGAREGEAPEPSESPEPSPSPEASPTAEPTEAPDTEDAQGANNDDQGDTNDEHGDSGAATGGDTGDSHDDGGGGGD
jgi:hypothetical protein